jgi:DNA-binding LytR/AlgR family response regulator
MKFSLIIDPNTDEEVIIKVHQQSSLTDQIEHLILQHNGSGRIAAYADDEMKLLTFDEIECITVLDGKTYAIDAHNQKYRLKQRLYELEAIVPSFFIRINKSTLANEKQIERFVATFSGAVDALFRCGYRDYVSRRCFSQIKRRYQK